MAQKKRTNEDWRKIIAEQRNSGQRQDEWCASNGINLHTMRDRISRLNKIDTKEKSKCKSKTPTEAPPKWVKVKTRTQKSKEHEPKIYIEIGTIKISASNDYPPENIAEILKRLNISC